MVMTARRLLANPPVVKDRLPAVLPGSLRAFGAPAAHHLALWVSNLVSQNAS
ncbi:MAG: hypothetical protein H6Q05_5115 [Acidobacteria bacterium]|nr:hypothetical protein [Acidobacteriota bacterium]